MRVSFRFYAMLSAALECLSVTKERARNCLGILDVSHELCLLLCSRITILALLFANQSFAAASLTSLEQLFWPMGAISS